MQEGRAVQEHDEGDSGAPELATLTRDRVSRLPAALWYRSGLPNCSSSQRILQSMLASSFSSISFLKGTQGSGPYNPLPCLPHCQAEGRPEASLAPTDLKMRKLEMPNMTKVRPVPKATMASMERGAVGRRGYQGGPTGHGCQAAMHP